jgi:vacuolar-type H+-ATPase subunit C/Vma6
MSDYDYLNARVRGMSTSLLSREFYEQVLAAWTESILLDALLGSSYAVDVQEARARHASAPLSHAIEAAVRSNAASAFARVMAAAPPGPRRLLAIQINRWDVTNVITLLRTRLADAGPHEAVAAVLPLGELGEAQLGTLAAEKDVASLADALTSWKQPIGFEMRRAIRECPSPGDPRALESALHRAYFAWALAQLRENDPAEALVRDSVRRHIDMLNVIAILTMIKAGRETGPADGDAKGAVPDRSDRDEPELIERGTLAEKFLRELLSCDSLEAAFEALEGTYFAPGVEKGILTYGQSQSLGVMERFLEVVSIEHECRLFRQDLLGMAVPLGFIWRKYSECVNLRLLARGALFRMPANMVRLELVHV